jgi:hypothetical protein
VFVSPAIRLDPHPQPVRGRCRRARREHVERLRPRRLQQVERLEAGWVDRQHVGAIALPGHDGLRLPDLVEHVAGHAAYKFVHAIVDGQPEVGTRPSRPWRCGSRRSRRARTPPRASRRARPRSAPRRAATPPAAFERQFVKFEVDGLLRADARTRAEVYATSLDPVTGWLTCAEVRRLEDLEPEPPAAPTVMDVVNQTTPPAGVRNLSGACWTPTCGRS